MPAIINATPSTTSITVWLSGMSSSYNETKKRTVAWTVDGTTWTKTITIPNKSSTGGNAVLSNLEPGTTYTIGAYVTFDTGSDNYFTDVTTKDVDFGGSLKISNVTMHSITAGLTGMNSSYPSSHRMRITWYIAGNKKYSFTFYAGPTKTDTYTYTDLKANTDYLVEITVEDMSNGKDWSWSKWVSTDSLPKWSWSSSNGSASASQTSQAYRALTNKGKTSSFSYKVWDDLCEKVSALREAAEYSSWDSYYLKLDETKMGASGKIMTADRFNSIRNNLNKVYSTGLPVVKKGDIIYGSYFTTLAECINYAIDRL